jgi:hypothetical protein
MFAAIVAALSVFALAVSAHAQTKTPIRIGLSIAQTGPLSGGRKIRTGGAADLARRRQCRRRPARTPGGAGGLRRPEQPVDDAGHLFQVAGRRQGRPGSSRLTRPIPRRRSCRSSSSAICC